jgi:hypothetical protein
VVLLDAPPSPLELDVVAAPPSPPVVELDVGELAALVDDGSPLVASPPPHAATHAAIAAIVQRATSASRRDVT